MDFLTLSVLVVFALILIGIGWIYADNSSPLAFNMGNRRVRVLQVAFGAFTVLGAQELVGFTSLAAGLGVTVIALPLGFAVGAVIIALIAEPARRRSSDANLMTAPDYLALVYDRRSAVLGTLINVLALGAVLLIQLVFGAFAIEAVTGISFAAALIFISVVVTTYVLIGGYNAILATDVVQGLAMLFLVTVLVSHLFGEPPPDTTSEIFRLVDAVMLPEQPWSLATFSSVLVLFASGVAAIVGGADIWQRILSADSADSSRRGLFGTALLYLLFGTGIVLVSIAILHYYPELEPDNAFVDFITRYVPEAILALAVVGIFAALISTADTEVLVVSLMLSTEAQRWGLNPAVDTLDTRRLVVVVVFLAALIGVATRDALADVYFALLSLLLITGPLMAAPLLGRGSRNSVFYATAASLGIFGLLLLTGLLATGAWSLTLLIPFLPVFMIANQQRT